MKKGQITIFIILGLVLLITVATVLYFVSTEAQKPWRKTAKIPEDIRPVYDMVNDCTKIALKQGLIIQGLQSGYITIPAFVTSNPESYLSADLFNTILIPYWYYQGENRIPSKPLMQKQLGKYVKQRILECVDLKSFEPKLIVKDFGPPDVLITFAEEDVVADVKWLLEIKTFERITTQTEYYAHQDIRYNEMYELAVKILEEENKQEWFEKLTIDLMSADQKIPTGGLEISCKQKKWNIEKIQERLKEILFYTIPMIRIKNTPELKPLAKKSVYDDLKELAEEEKEKLIRGKTEKIKQPEYIPEDVYEINKMTFDIHIPQTDLKASFIYDKSRLMLSALPHDGKWLKSRKVKGSKQLIPFFCMNQWHFSYDVIYPVKLVIKDEKAFDNEGYIFQMAFPIVIDDNAPERTNFGIRQFEPMYIGTEFCEEKDGEEVEITVLGFEPGLPMAVELEDVDLVLECVSIECEAGKTIVQTDGTINLRTRIPRGCGNPRIVARKEGYLSAKTWLISNKAEIIMKPLQKLTPEFVIQPYLAPTKQWQTEQNRFKTDENEKIMLSIKLKENFEKSLNSQNSLRKLYLKPAKNKSYSKFSKGEEYEQYKIFPSNETVQLLLDNAEYEIEIYLLKNDMILGGYKNLNLSIDYEEVLGKEKIQFNIVEYRPNPANEEDLVKMMNFLDKGKYNDEDYKMALKPIMT